MLTYIKPVSCLTTRILRPLCITGMSLLVVGCLDSFVKPEATVDRGLEETLPPYSGPRAMVAVTDFDGGTELSFNLEKYSGYAEGLKDMLTTALVQSKRYRVLERQNIDSVKNEIGLSEAGYTDETGKQRGNVKGADIAVIASVTGWDPGTSGGSAKLGGLVGGKAGALLGSIGGGYKKSTMAMDIRIVDLDTTEVLAATRVESVAKDVNIGGALSAATGGVGGGGSLGTFAKTPMEKAIRTAIYEATKYIVENTPADYMRH